MALYVLLQDHINLSLTVYRAIILSRTRNSRSLDIIWNTSFNHH